MVDREGGGMTLGGCRPLAGKLAYSSEAVMPASGVPQDVHVDPGPFMGSDRIAPPPPVLRVINVSPHPAAATPPVDHSENAAMQAAVATLETLLREAHEITCAITDTVTQARETETQAMTTAVHLQERLQLGAQMLKAFQTQIGRIENSLAQFNDHIRAQERRVEAAEAKMLQHIADVQQQLTAALGAALQRIEDAARVAWENVDQPLEARASKTAARAFAADAHSESAPLPAPEIHVMPPLRLHTWTAKSG